MVSPEDASSEQHACGVVVTFLPTTATQAIILVVRDRSAKVELMRVKIMSGLAAPRTALFGLRTGL